jgi:hypothetical protein
MTISPSPITVFSNFKPARALRWIFAAAALAAIAVPGAADASRGARGVGAYDGTWNVTFAPRAGNCSSTNTVPFMVSGTRVSSAGGGKVTGGVSPPRRSGGPDIRRRIVGERQRPARRQFGCRQLERDHFRRPLQRQLASYTELVATIYRRPRVRGDDLMWSNG